MSGTVTPGRFIWYDLMTPDPEGAIDFYTKVVGWSITDWKHGGEEGALPYKMWTAGEKPVGGVIALPEAAKAQGAPPQWVAYCTVPDANAAASKNEELGGEILMAPKTVPGVGTFGVLRDPQGAVFAPFTPEQEDLNQGGVPQPGEFSWHELATTDYEAAFEFYSGIFGWEKTDDLDMGEGMIYQMYGPGGESAESYGGMYTKPAEMPGPPHWLYYITVADIESGAGRVTENGGQILHGPIEVPGGDFIAMCMDPQGAGFALHAKG